MAPGFPQDIVARIKEETDIVSLVRGYVTLNPAGTSFKGLCPFHREKTPSFHVNPDRQIYKCFGCGEGGDVISFLMKIEGIPFPEALETLARPLDIDLARYLRDEEGEGERTAFHRANEAASAAWQQALWDDRTGRAARSYLEGRGFGEEILRRFEVGWAPPGTEWLIGALRQAGVDEDLAQRAGLLRTKDDRAPFAYFRGRIIFPIKNIAQRIVGFGGRVLEQGEPKYLNSSDSTYFSKGKLLYGFAVSRISIARLRTAILVEGYLDLLALAQSGIGNVVATCGTAFTADQARILRRGCRMLLVLFDGDRAGLQAAVRACHVAHAAGLEAQVARLPAGEDPASLLNSRDRARMEEVLAGAVGYLPFLRLLVEERGGGRQGQERALRQALKTIAEVQDPIRQEYLLQEAAELFSMRVEILRQTLDAASAESAGRPAAGRDAPGAPAPRRRPERPASPGRRGGIRSQTAVDRPRIEATLLAHVLADASGGAAREFLRTGADHAFTVPAARQLAAEIAAWRDANRDDSPVAFVQQRWHGADESFRSYVSDLLTEEVVPDSTDFEQVVRDCLRRLEEDSRWRQL